MTHSSCPGMRFRKGTTLIQLFEMVPEHGTAEAWFEQQRWGEAGKPAHCPICVSTDRIVKLHRASLYLMDVVPVGVILVFGLVR